MSIKDETAAINRDAARIRAIRQDMIAELAALDVAERREAKRREGDEIRAYIASVEAAARSLKP